MVFSIEEHSMIGGLGSSLAEHMSQIKDMPPLHIIGINDFFPHAGDYEYLIIKNGLDIESIYSRIIKEYEK